MFINALYRQQYYEALDLIINCVHSWFDQPGYSTYKNLQELLFKAIIKAMILNLSYSMCHSSTRMTSTLLTYKPN